MSIWERTKELFNGSSAEKLEFSESVEELNENLVQKKIDEMSDSLLEEEIEKRLNEKVGRFQDFFMDPEKEMKNNLKNSIYSSIWSEMSDKRKRQIEELERQRNNYLVEAILSQITEDALTPDTATGNILDISSDNKEIQKELEFLDEKFGFDSIAETLAPDMVFYGSYLLRTEVVSKDDRKKDPIESGETFENKDPVEEETDGLISIIDDVDQTEVIPINKFNKPDGFLVMGTRGKVYKVDSSRYVNFALVNKTQRVDVLKSFIGSYVQDSYLNDLRFMKGIPRYVRVGKSIFHSYLPKLKELQLLEALIPASKLQKLAGGTLLGVQMPTGYDLPKALAACRKIEGMINKKISVDTESGDISLSDIMNAAGTMKCVPLLGEKGQLQRMETRSDEPDDLLSSVEDIRRVIMGGTSVPYEIIFGDDGGNKGELLKKYARYLRLLKSVQRSLIEGFKQIIFIHLANKDIDVTESDLKINFIQKLVEIDSMDRLEFLDSSVGMISTLSDFIRELGDSEIGNNVNYQEFLDFLDKQFTLLGLPNLIEGKYEKPDDGDVVDDGGEE